jgi:hypothetical protein
MADFYSATVRRSNRFRGPISLRFLQPARLVLLAVLAAGAQMIVQRVKVGSPR